MLKVGFTTEGTREIQKLFGDKIIQFPKPVSLIKALVKQCVGDGEFVMDFFAGSATTAQAVLEQNREDGIGRRYVLVQLPEPLQEPKKLSGDLELTTIADIGKERIRRVIKKLKDEAKGKLDLKDREEPEDLGFKAFKLAESNYRPWKGVEEKDGEAFARTMAMFIDPLLPGWKPVNVIYEVALKEGYTLTCNVEEVKGTAGNAVYRVTDADKGQSFLICLDHKLKTAAIKALGLKKDDLFICRDVALTDEQAANLALQCKLKTT